MQSTLCNPLDIPYRFQDLSFGPFYRAVFREGADPSLIEYKGRYFLFISMSGGFWHSGNLMHWEFVATPAFPIYDYAPDARVVDGYLVVCASRPGKPCPFFRTQDPLAGEWEEIPGTFSFWDPNVFQDDDGRLYLYWGCSNKKPIMCVELDRTTFTRIGESTPFISSDEKQHGWERNGPNHNPNDDTKSIFLKILAGTAPFIEGAWMTKHAGKYYLQYSAPGTELNTYADGYYLGDSPVGPFTYSPHSPFSSKPGGFISAAGHGSTFQDAYGNWWHAATMRISINHMFERRVGLFPAGFDADGVLFCNQEFADYPMAFPSGPVDPWSVSAKWMLLSYRSPVTASSSDPAHGAGLAVDENAQTWWLPEDSRPGHWVQTEISAGSSVHAIQVNIAEHDLKPPKKEREYVFAAPWWRQIDTTEPPLEVLLEASMDGETWVILLDTRGAELSRSHLYVELEEPALYRYVRVTGFKQPYAGRFAVSGLRVFGRGNGETPAAVSPRVRRTAPLNAMIEWEAVAGAQGYNVRYGLAADKLYSSWQVYDQTSLDLSSLNAGYAYWVAVDTFNENGITKGESIAITADAQAESLHASQGDG
jgi:xylan 1,4-beta-xylosidase